MMNHRGFAVGFRRLAVSRSSSRALSTQGFDTIALHGGYTPDKEATYGLGKKHRVLLFFWGEGGC